MQMTHREMLNWARMNLKNLSSEINEYFACKPFVVDGVIDNENNDHALVVRFRNVPPVPHLPFKVGDIVHNIRVSMDYLAHAIAEKYDPTFAARSTRIAFPVCKKRRLWRSKVEHTEMDKWCPAGAIAVFEKLQPYNTQWGADHPFIGATDLDNPHKHRTLVSVRPDLASISYGQIGRDDAYTLELTDPEPLFVDGCRIARFKYNPVATGNQHGAVQANVSFSLLFDRNTAAANWEIRTYLKTCIDFLESQAFPELEPFTR